MNLSELFDKILTVNFIAVCLAIVSVTYYIRKTINIVCDNIEDSKIYKILLSLFPLILAVLFAIPSGVLEGDTFSKRIILSIIAAYFSEKFIYQLLVKRLSMFDIKIKEKKEEKIEDEEEVEEKTKEENTEKDTKEEEETEEDKDS